MNVTIENFPFTLQFGEREALKMLKRAGFDGVDFSFNKLANGESIDLSDHINQAKRTKKILDETGLCCNQAHAPFELKYGDKFSLENKAFSNVIRSFEFAKIIGIKTIVVHSINVPTNEDFYAYNFDYYKTLESYAKDCGLHIAVENLVKSIFWRPERLSQFIRQLNSPVFNACIDVGHCALMGVPPEDFISGMDKGVIGCVHLHDTDGKVDRHWIPYEGIQDWDKTIKALVEYGFDGDINLEVIHSFDNLPSDLYEPLLLYSATVGKYLKKLFLDTKKEIEKIK